MGPVSPIEFIPIAEKTNLIIPLGYEIIRKALCFLNRLNEQGHSTVGISINISAIQLVKTDFITNLFRIISETKVNAELIELEITESIFVSNHENINRILGELRAIGIKIAIDDFGKGYSSLARERELNVDCLNIDKYFLDKLIALKDEEAITGDIISMGHKLGHCVIAEGVEYEQQLKYLAEHHCDKIDWVEILDNALLFDPYDRTKFDIVVTLLILVTCLMERPVKPPPMKTPLVKIYQNE